MLSPPVLAGERGRLPAFPHLPAAAAAIAGLGPRDCRWPLGAPDDDAFRFCGAPARAGASYCAGHARRAVAGRFASGRRG